MKRCVIAVLALVLVACGGGQKANFSDATDRLDVVSWWVSPSEHPALEVLLNAFKAKNSGVNVTDGSIAGVGRRVISTIADITRGRGMKTSGPTTRRNSTFQSA